MAVDGGVGEHLAQGVEQQQQAAALFRRARVLGESSVGGEASDVADAYAGGVVAAAMSSYLGDRAAYLNASVEQYDVVVAYGSETLLTVPTVDVGGGERFALASGGAMDYDFVNLSHFLLFY